MRRIYQRRGGCSSRWRRCLDRCRTRHVLGSAGHGAHHRHWVASRHDRVRGIYPRPWIEPWPAGSPPGVKDGTPWSALQGQGPLIRCRIAIRVQHPEVSTPEGPARIESVGGAGDQYRAVHRCTLAKMRPSTCSLSRPLAWFGCAIVTAAIESSPSTLFGVAVRQAQAVCRQTCAEII
jgi:hypothetical protein